MQWSLFDTHPSNGEKVDIKVADYAPSKVVLTLHLSILCFQMA